MRPQFGIGLIAPVSRRQIHKRFFLNRFAHAIAAQLLIRHGWNFDVNVDTIEQRPADLAEVPRLATAGDGRGA
jgi:hypothetical protein